MSGAVVILVAIFAYLLFIWKSGKVYPILYLFLFVYIVQYVVSVYLIYNEYPVLRKQMPLSQEQLFDFVIPALAVLFLGVFLFNKDLPLEKAIKQVDKKQAMVLGHILVFSSYFFEVLEALNVPGLKPITSFTYYLKFIGGMAYLFSPSIVGYLILGFVYLDLVRDALNVGIFIDFFVWSTYLFFIVCLLRQFSFLVRFGFIVGAVPVLVLIQSVKYEYRAETWSGRKEVGVGSLTDLAEDKQKKENDPFSKSEGVIRTVGRLNQGWHVGMVLKWVPKRQPFADGSDFLTDIEGTILPRFFFPDKKVIGGQDKFKKYTGHELTKSTSMTIGVLGDFYINFGRWGAFIGLFIFGAVVAKLLYFFISRHVLTDPVNLVWVPFLFSYLVRANNDFYIVINSFVKGYLIFLLVNYVRKRM